MRKGTWVHWHWGKSEAEGKVQEKFMEPVSRMINGTVVKRNASKEEPAYLIRQADGGEVLKSASELKTGKKAK